MPSTITEDPNTRELHFGVLPTPHHEWTIEVPTHTVSMSSRGSATMPRAFRPSSWQIDEYLTNVVPEALWRYGGGTLAVANLPARVSSLALQRLIEQRFGVALHRVSLPPHLWGAVDA